MLAAYRQAESTLGSEKPGCKLPWELLAAIGKVESGHARGGAVDAEGTTLQPILGPALDGVGFARISDTDGGALDGDTTFDRAVGPMQFIPSTWANWSADGNGDGQRDPHNVYDAALAAGRYLCAGDRDLSTQAGLEGAILSYNHSADYLRTVLAWLEFYRKGAHAVPDGKGVLPRSPGAGNPSRPAGQAPGSDSRRPGGGSTSPGGGSGPSSGTTSSPRPTASATGSVTPRDPDPAPSGTSEPTASESPSPTDTSCPTPSPSPSGSESGSSDSATSSPSPSATDDPCTTPEENEPEESSTPSSSSSLTVSGPAN